MNSIVALELYRSNGLWVFDDPTVGLQKEPFIAGIDVMLDHIAAEIPNADTGFTILVAATPFPGHQFRLDWQRGEHGGNWYLENELGMEGWLCPALYKYFDPDPNRLYVQVKPTKE